MSIKIEHIATVLSLGGAILLSAGTPILVVWSLVLQILGGFLWITYAHQTGQRSLLVVNAGFVVIEIIGLINWV